MKNKTKFLLALSLIAMLTVLFAISVSAAEPVETWDISATSSDSVTAYLYNDPNNSGMYTLTISGTGNMKDWTDTYSFDTPWYSYRPSMTSVIIEEGVTNIGSCAFCALPALPDSLLSIVIPDSVTSIGESAFEYCSSLTSIVITDSIVSIGTSAFRSCSSLVIYTEAQSKPSGWNYLDRPVVWDYKNNEVASDGYIYVSIDGLRYGIKNGEAMVAGQPTAITSANVHSNITYKDMTYPVTSIGDGAFAYCCMLKTITLPEKMNFIGTGAFRHCCSLKSITVPYGVTDLSSMFDMCYYLESVYIPITMIKVDGGFMECCGVTVYCEAPQKPKDWYDDWNFVWTDYYEDYETGEWIEDNVYATVVWGYNNVTTNEEYDYVVHDGKASLTKYKGSSTEIVIPSTIDGYEVEYFGTIFRENKEITKVIIPDSVKTISAYAFSSCNGLTSIVIPKSVTKVDYGAFSSCTNLTIYAEAESQPSGWSSRWNYSKCPVVWDCNFDADACMNSIFTFKGYSFGWTGSMAVGFEIDYEAIARYEGKTGEALDFGVVFAGFDALGGNMPLDANGNAHADVVKFSTKGYDYIQYDFVITDMTEEYFDISFVISAYICNGAMTKFVQANGLSDTVIGISYNEAKGA